MQLTGLVFVIATICAVATPIPNRAFDNHRPVFYSRPGLVLSKYRRRASVMAGAFEFSTPNTAYAYNAGTKEGAITQPGRSWYRKVLDSLFKRSEDLLEDSRRDRAAYGWPAEPSDVEPFQEDDFDSEDMKPWAPDDIPKIQINPPLDDVQTNSNQ